jgi:pilus assembly protein Flp/PilA
MNTCGPWLRALVRGQGPTSRTTPRAERGASAVEYGLLIAGIAALIVVIVFAFGDNIGDVLFQDTCQQMVAQRGTGDCV